MWFLLVTFVFLLLVISAFVAGGLAFTTTLGAVNLPAVGLLMAAVFSFGIALFLSARKSRQSPRRLSESDRLKQASGSASTRQAVEEESAWS